MPQALTLRGMVCFCIENGFCEDLRILIRLACGPYSFVGILLDLALDSKRSQRHCKVVGEILGCVVAAVAAGERLGVEVGGALAEAVGVAAASS